MGCTRCEESLWHDSAIESWSQTTKIMKWKHDIAIESWSYTIKVLKWN